VKQVRALTRRLPVPKGKVGLAPQRLPSVRLFTGSWNHDRNGKSAFTEYQGRLCGRCFTHARLVKWQTRQT
jgi:hypothetical protein